MQNNPCLQMYKFCLVEVQLTFFPTWKRPVLPPFACLFQHFWSKNVNFKKISPLNRFKQLTGFLINEVNKIFNLCSYFYLYKTKI